MPYGLEKHEYTYYEKIAIALKVMGFPQIVQIEEFEGPKNWNGSTIELKENNFHFFPPVTREHYDIDNLSPTDVAIEVVDLYENWEHAC